jgi:hypothetical protein
VDIKVIFTATELRQMSGEEDFRIQEYINHSESMISQWRNQQSSGIPPKYVADLEVKIKRMELRINGFKQILEDRHAEERKRRNTPEFRQKVNSIKEKYPWIAMNSN